MIGPSGLASALAAIVLGIAVFSAVRLAASAGRRWNGEMDADAMHVLMGVAMAGMFVPRLAILPVSAWKVVFVAGGLWFGWRVGQVRHDRLAGYGGHGGHPGFSGSYCRHPLPHLVDCLAMLYMLWAVPALRAPGPVAAAGVMGTGGARLPVVGLALALCICGYVVWLGDRIQLAGVTGIPGEPAARALPPATPARVAGLAARPLLVPRAATCCKIAMGVAMGIMLIDLI